MSGETQELGGAYFATGKSSAWGWWLPLLLLVSGFCVYAAWFLGYIQERPRELGGGLVLVGSLLTMLKLSRR